MRQTIFLLLFILIIVSSGAKMGNVEVEQLLLMSGGGLTLDSVTSNPCGGVNYQAGSLFYSTNGQNACFCKADQTGYFLATPDTACVY